MQSANQPDEKQIEYLTPTPVSKLLQIPESTLAVWRCTGRVRLAYFFGKDLRAARHTYSVSGLLGQEACRRAGKADALARATSRCTC